MNETSPKALILRISGLLFCLLPPVLTVLFYFPIWKVKGGEYALCGFTLLLLLLSAAPLFNVIKRLLSSPSAHTMWFIIFIVFLLLSKIADEMTVISFSGFIGNIIGALFFKGADKTARKMRKGN